MEDEPALRDLTARTVSAIGYTVLTAGGIAGALEIARDLTKEIDLLLTDVVMPDVLGQELAAQVRRLRPGLPVMFMSGFARPSLPDAEQPLIGPLLLKPFTEAELLNMIAEVLDSNDLSPHAET